MELWDLYDKNRKPLNKIHKRGDALAKGEYHLAVSVAAVNDKNEILLTLRSKDKYPYPNCWEITTGSCLAGENSRTGAKRELFEETGISADIEDLIYIDTICDDKDNFILDFFIVKKNIAAEKLKLQPHETQDAMWVSFKDLEKMSKSGLAPNSLERIKILKSYFTKSNP
ncbi:MAG: NUDIX domain-containing protein [Clostridia bacterium]|nr:NUDIX domain-containing protein [Clostridia bacterium]